MVQEGELDWKGHRVNIESIRSAGLKWFSKHCIIYILICNNNIKLLKLLFLFLKINLVFILIKVTIYDI